MQQDRLEGWMVKQIENADLAKETVIQLPPPRSSSTAASSSRLASGKPSAATPRRPKGGVSASRRSITAAGQEMCSLLPPQSPHAASTRPERDTTIEMFQKRDPDESVEKLWRAQFHDRQQPCVEGDHVDRTKVLHNMKDKQQNGDDEQSPLFLWGLPREHVLEFIRQSVLPSSWAYVLVEFNFVFQTLANQPYVNRNPTSRAVGEWEAVPNEEDEAARVNRIM
ncbi:unnamed protein product [Phytophthora lilii]|uniref:Unnamed protein product n=1 Tax=Phytophthora lilii TaxID=2077276 RepID=A0A9W7D7C2_9STRA|nr:unnamed protein product [Phytophthora lilii]